MPGAIPLSVVTIFFTILIRELSILLVFIEPILGFVNPVYIFSTSIIFALYYYFLKLSEFILLFILNP